MRRIERPHQKRGEPDAALSPVGRIDVPFRRGVAELLLLRPHDHIVVRLLAVVELGPLHARSGARYRRDVLDEELREPLFRDAAHRPQSDAEAVGEDQPLVDPGLARQVGVRELPGREHDLEVLVAHGIAVVVHVAEPVVGPDLLELAVGLEQRVLVPEPDVPDGGQVPADVGKGQRVVRCKRPGLDVLEPVAEPRHPDMVLQEGPFEHELVRRDLEALDQGGIDAQPEDRGPGQHRQDRQGDHDRAAVGGHHDGSGRREGEERHDREHQHPDVHVGVGRAEQHAVVGREQAEPIQVEVRGEADQDERGQDAEVAPDGRRRGSALPRDQQPAPRQVDQRRHQEGEDQQAADAVIDIIEQRIGEEEERDVLLEQGIADACRHARQVDQDLPALPGPESEGRERPDGGDSDRGPADQFAQVDLLQRRDAFAHAVHPRKREAAA